MKISIVEEMEKTNILGMKIICSIFLIEKMAVSFRI